MPISLAKGYESTSNSMPSAWFLPGIFITLVYVLLLFHDLDPFSEMFLTRCLWKTLDLALTYLYSMHQAQHQKELAEFGPYDSILVDGEQRQIPLTLGDLSDPSRPGYEHCYGVVGTMLKGAYTAVKLHNCNLDNSLSMEVHASVTDFLTSSDNKVLHDEVDKELETPLLSPIHFFFAHTHSITLFGVRTCCTAHWLHSFVMPHTRVLSLVYAHTQYKTFILHLDTSMCVTWLAHVCGMTCQHACHNIAETSPSSSMNASSLQHTTTYYNTLQYTAKHTATHSDTLQHCRHVTEQLNECRLTLRITAQDVW